MGKVDMTWHYIRFRCPEDDEMLSERSSLFRIDDSDLLLLPIYSGNDMQIREEDMFYSKKYRKLRQN